MYSVYIIWFLNQCQRVGLDIARKIIYEKENEIEIKEYLKSIENIVLNNAANNNKDEEEAATSSNKTISAVDIKSIMRKKQNILNDQ